MNPIATCQQSTASSRPRSCFISNHSSSITYHLDSSTWTSNVSPRHRISAIRQTHSRAESSGRQEGTCPRPVWPQSPRGMETSTSGVAAGPRKKVGSLDEDRGCGRTLADAVSGKPMDRSCLPSHSRGVCSCLSARLVQCTL
jgi:hypothetical protein